MNKVELNRLSQVNNNEQNFLAALNENLKRIQEAINDTLSRSGVTPNQMEEVLDMNGNRICNVGPAVELTDVVTKQDIQNIIDAANEAITRLDGLVEAGRTALMNYAQEYIYPTVTAALDGAQDAQRAAEQARDALVLDPGYQAVVANLTNLLALANDLANVDTLVNNLTNIDTVANNITDVSTVAGVSSAVSTLAEMTSTLTALENDLTNIDTVAGSIADVNTVAGLSSAVSSLAAISSELTALYNNITAINAVYADLTKIDAVEGKLTEIEAVYDALSDITSVSAALTDLATIVTNLTDLLSIATNMTSLLAVSNDLTNLDAIAADLTNLDAVASNLAAILAAPTYASQAAASASNAQIWAEGTDTQVVPLGGQHSAKVWAQYIEEIIAGTRVYGGTFDPTTATATLTSSAKAKLGITSDTIVLTNDNTVVTGYEANEGIEYFVSVDGTFASLTLHEGDILWSTGSAWKKIDNSVTVIPDATESVKGIAALASTAEAEAGANDTKVMTPLKTKQAILDKSYTKSEMDTALASKQDTLTAGTGINFVSSRVVESFTTTGTLSIVDGIASGFSQSNFATSTYAIDTAQDFEFYTKMKATNTLYRYQSCFVCPYVFYVGFGNNGTFIINTGNGSSWGTEISAGSWSLNTWYYLKVVRSSSVLTAYVSTDGSTWTTLGTGGSASGNSGYFTIGYETAYPSAYLRGNIDFNETKIVVDGNVVWSPFTTVTDGNTYVETDIGSGSDSPTTSTTGYIGKTYVKSDGSVFVCTGVNGSSYVWTKVDNSDCLHNTATGTNSLTIGGTATNATASVNIGVGSAATGSTTVAIGQNARSTAAQAYEIGTGTNSNHHTLRIGFYLNGANVGYTLLDGNTGKVPTDRYVSMVGADSTNAGTIGAVPAPAAGDNEKFLRGDGTWAEAGSVATYDSTTKTIQL